MNTFDDFLSGRIGIRCETKEEYDRLMQECYGHGKKWASGEVATSNPNYYHKGICIRSGACYGDRIGVAYDDGSAIPFSTIFPADPWAEFVAGKCYLRVTKEEWPEFAKRCEAAGLKWWDGRLASQKRGISMEDVGEAIYWVQANKKLNSAHAQKYCGIHLLPIRPFSAIARPEAEPFVGVIVVSQSGDAMKATLIVKSDHPAEAEATVIVNGRVDRKRSAAKALNKLLGLDVAEVRATVSVDTSALKASLESVRRALDDLPNCAKVVVK